MAVNGGTIFSFAKAQPMFDNSRDWNGIVTMASAVDASNKANRGSASVAARVSRWLSECRQRRWIEVEKFTLFIVPPLAFCVKEPFVFCNSVKTSEALSQATRSWFSRFEFCKILLPGLPRRPAGVFRRRGLFDAPFEGRLGAFLISLFSVVADTLFKAETGLERDLAVSSVPSSEACFVDVMRCSFCTTIEEAKKRGLYSNGREEKPSERHTVKAHIKSKSDDLKGDSQHVDTLFLFADWDVQHFIVTHIFLSRTTSLAELWAETQIMLRR
jgi:hypothetical protein